MLHRLWQKIKKIRIASLGSFLAELVLYAVFVAAYYLLVLHFVAPRVKQVFDANRIYYAILAIGLILFQGVSLEMVTTALLRVIRRRWR